MSENICYELYLNLLMVRKRISEYKNKNHIFNEKTDKKIDKKIDEKTDKKTDEKGSTVDNEYHKINIKYQNTNTSIKYIPISYSKKLYHDMYHYYNARNDIIDRNSLHESDLINEREMSKDLIKYCHYNEKIINSDK